MADQIHKGIMTYQLVNNTRNVGDSGGQSTLLREKEDGSMEYKDDSEPEVGWAIRVGSYFASTFSAQDWWQTSKITEVISRTETPQATKVLFRTVSGSTYTWRKFE